MLPHRPGPIAVDPLLMDVLVMAADSANRSNWRRQERPVADGYPADASTCFLT